MRIAWFHHMCPTSLGFRLQGYTIVSRYDDLNAISDILSIYRAIQAH